MLHLKKILLAGTVLTALCSVAFAAGADDAAKPSMRERVDRILAENRGDCPADESCRPPRGRHHREQRPLTPEERAQREQRRAEWEKMTPEQRDEARAQWEKEGRERREQRDKEREQRREERAKAAMAKLSPEQRAEVEAFIKEDLAQRRASREKFEKMTPEQREAVLASRPHKMPPPGPRHHGGPRHGQHGPRPDCPAPDCPALPAD